MQVHVVDHSRTGDPTEIPPKVEPLRAVELRERSHASSGEPVDLERLLVTELRELADVPVGRDHQMPGRVGELIQQDERFPAAVDDERGLVLTLRGAAEDAALLLVCLLDVLEPPRSPQWFGHRAEVRVSPRQAGMVRVFVPAALAVSLVFGVARAGGQAFVVCFGDTPTIRGTPGDDRLTGTSSRDIINGLGGNDTIDGRGSDDALCGGAGNDVLRGSSGDDTLAGDDGNDRLDGGPGYDEASYYDAPVGVIANIAESVVTGVGRDSITLVEAIIGSNHADKMFGDPEFDYFEGGPGNDLLSGGGGDDIVNGQDGNDVLRGGGGFDGVTYFDTGHSVTVNLARGRAVGSGADRLAGIEDIYGSDGWGDQLIGDKKPNWIFGYLGDDHIEGRGGADVLSGGDGQDRISGGPGRDRLNGNEGRDRLDGGPGRDLCRRGERKLRCP
jgi:Ca2+-binding RTX toxin-like protein